MKPATIQPDAGRALLGRRLVVGGALALGAQLAWRTSFAEQAATNATSTAVSEGGFRYLPQPGNPFSGGVAALPGQGLVRVRLRELAPLEQGLDLIAHHLKSEGRPLSALAGLELRAPSVMSRPEFSTFNGRYLAALRARGLITSEVAPLARSDMVPLYDPPKIDVLSAFTYAAPASARMGGAGPDFQISGRPEHDEAHVIAPGDVSPAGMNRKARFVFEQLRQSVSALGARWSDITGAQIYMTEPLPLVMDAVRASGLPSLAVSIFPGSTPVIGFEAIPYAFEADVRAIGLEQII